MSCLGQLSTKCFPLLLFWQCHGACASRNKALAVREFANTSAIIQSLHSNNSAAIDALPDDCSDNRRACQGCGTVLTCRCITSEGPFSPQPALPTAATQNAQTDWFWLPRADTATLTTRLLLQAAGIFDSEPHHKPSNTPSTGHLKTCLSQISTLRKKLSWLSKGIPAYLQRLWGIHTLQTNCTHHSCVYMRDWIFFWDSNHYLST